LEKLFENIKLLNEIDDLILIHNCGVTFPSYENLKKSKSYLFQNSNNSVLQSEEVSEYLFKEKSLNKSVRIINFHNTCSSGTAALTYAWKRLRLNISKKILIISFEISNNNYFTLNSLGSLGVVNTKATSIENTMMPFDKGRSGFIKADALTYTIIENTPSCLGNPIAQILAGSTTCDAHSLTDGIESGELVAKTMSNALELSGLNASDVNYINAHGSSTYLNDLIEIRGIQKVFNSKKDLILSSTKSFFGHALCATGNLEVNSILAMFEDNFIIGNLNYQNHESSLNIQIPAQSMLSKKVEIVLKNSFGFGGYNSSIILKNMI
jgi:3-oxoacyl-[acyl-carrier-protein] synthase II